MTIWLVVIRARRIFSEDRVVVSASFVRRINLSKNVDSVRESGSRIPATAFCVGFLDVETGHVEE